jgi:hypothetical protein
MQLHHLRVRAGKDQPGSRIAHGTERTENTGMGLSCIDGYWRARAFGCPAVGAASLLPHARFIPAPPFDGLIGMRGGDSFQCLREFL